MHYTLDNLTAKDAVSGDTVEVMLEGKIYITEVDDYGVQRFHRNTVLDYMFHHDWSGRELNMVGRDIHNGMLNLNTLAIAFYNDKFDKRDYCEIIMSGYSVSGFCDIPDFEDWYIQNPAWGDTAPSRICSEEN